MAARLRTISRRPLILVGGGTLLVLVLVAVLVHHKAALDDQAQMSVSFTALLSGHLGAVYPPRTTMTSPPGFLLLAAPVFALLGGDPSARTPQLVVGVLSACFLTVAALRLGRRLIPAAAPSAGLLVTAGLLLGAPTLCALDRAYHPEDIVAMAFVLLALADTATGHDRRVGLALGAALLTRQWVLPVMVPVLLASGPGWRRVGATAGALCVVVLAPFAALEPAGLLRALEAKTVTLGPYTVWPSLRLPASLAYTVARLAPLMCCVPAFLVLRRRWAGTPIRLVQVTAAVAAFGGFRVVLDTAAWPYYALPLFVPLAVLALYDPDRRRRPWTLVAVLVIEILQWREPHFSIGPQTMLVMAVLLLTTEIGALAWAWRTAYGPAVPTSPPIMAAEEGRRSHASGVHPPPRAALSANGSAEVLAHGP